MSVRTLIVDDDPLVRTGLRLMLGGDPSIEIVGEVADGTEVAAAVDEAAPQVVLMDIRMPELDGIEATRRLVTRSAAPTVVMLTTFDADETVLAALRAGAAGFLLKHAAPEEIVAAVHRAAEGEPVFSPAVLRTLVGHARASAPDDREGDRTTEAWARLSDRERQIAAAVARGLSNTDIAAELFVSAGTVKADISAMLGRLGLTNRIQLAILAHERVG